MLLNQKARIETYLSEKDKAHKKLAKRVGSGCDLVGRRSLPTPEARGSNPVISKIEIEHSFTVFKRLK